MSEETLISTGRDSAADWPIDRPLPQNGSARLGRPASDPRPRAEGKFLFAGDHKLYVHGVTYGPFRARADGCEYPAADVVQSDFAAMRANGINAIRTYTAPPRWLLDCAHEHGLRVMVGLAWGQHVTFLDDRSTTRHALQAVRAGVKQCAGHPAVLAYAIGNEIPAPIVRWHRPRRVEDWLRRLCEAAKSEEPDAAVSYANYPSTEYLRLPFLDFACFNVFLEDQARLETYLARLHNVVGERPLLLTEIGLDSHRHGLTAQANALREQLATAFRAGCAGAFVFSFTDDWHRGGHDVDDWAFGLTDRRRRPKPALAAVGDGCRRLPLQPGADCPHISIVVCSFNGARTLRDCFDGLRRLDYPRFEVIVVDDGSTDGTAQLGESYGYRVLRTDRRGLASARNAGIEASRGEIVAFIDDDARPDSDWLTYLATSFARSEHAAVGGPNIAPQGEPPTAQCVANSPGGPVHVLVSDTEAEHLPGCNCAFRKSALELVEGFDPQFVAAGDDVDICWRLTERGYTLAYNPAAVVWHRRRASLRAYWRQQRGYGRAEALLMRKWPERYNGLGQVGWKGRMYAGAVAGRRSGRIYYGPWGAAPFQALYEPAGCKLAAYPLMPEWYALIALLLAFAVLALTWTTALVALPLLALCVALTVARALGGAAMATFEGPRRRLKLRLVTALCHLIQPAARLAGRAGVALAAPAHPPMAGWAAPLPHSFRIWSESGRPTAEWLSRLTALLRARAQAVALGGAFDRWDVEVRGGVTGSARARMAIEEHGGGRQLLRFRVWPRISVLGAGATAAAGALAALAFVQSSPLAGALLGATCALLLTRTLAQCGAGIAVLAHCIGCMVDGAPAWQPADREPLTAPAPPTPPATDPARRSASKPPW